MSLKIFNLIGQKIATLVNEDQLAGYYQEQFNARTLASSMYVHRLSIADDGGNGPVDQSKIACKQALARSRGPVVSILNLEGIDLATFQRFAELITNDTPQSRIMVPQQSLQRNRQVRKYFS